MASNLFGHFHVTPTLTTMHEACALFPKYGDYQEARKHALKLAYWPAGASGGGKVCDLDWDWITGMKGPKACELRIEDEIGGWDNLRIIFYVFSKKLILPEDAMPRLWTIGVLQKKTKRFSSRDLEVFAARVMVVRKRKYSEHV